MIATRFLTLLMLAGVLLGYGCAEKQPAPAARPPAQLPARAKPDLDEKTLPPPRRALAATPDLSNAVYAINADTLNTMANNGVPADVVSTLRKLNGKTYSNTAVFLAAAKGATGQAALDQNQEAILRSALVVTLAEAPAGPRGELGEMVATPVAQRVTEFKIVYFDFDKY